MPETQIVAARKNGSERLSPPRKGLKKKASSAALKKRVRASILRSGDAELPPPFVAAIRDLEKALSMPIWMLIGNGDSRGSMDMAAFKGFQKVKDHIPAGPVGLLIESPGGLPTCAYYIARFFQRRSRQFVTIVPQYAKSAGTLLAIAGSKIIMGRDAELGPLDVQLYDAEKERYGSALNTVQSLERLNAAALTAVDQTMQLLAIRTTKKMESILPNVFNYVSNLMKPLIEKIDSVDFSEKSRALKMAEEYAARLLKAHYPKVRAEQIAHQLVEGYPDHGFVIDAQEAQHLLVDHRNEPLGLNVELASTETERIFHRLIPFLDELNVFGTLEEY